MTLLIYRFLLRPLLTLTMWLLSSFNEKIRVARIGRKRWRNDLEKRSLIPSELPGPRIHWHVASVGECEQALPVIDALAERNPGIVQTLSYSSPSLEKAIARHPDPILSRLSTISFAPRETRRDATAFFKKIDPDLLVLVRYDLWPEMLVAARRNGATAVLICGVIHAGTPRLRWYGRWFFRWLYGLLDVASMVDEESMHRLRSIAPTLPLRVDGDTRYDRVLDRTRSGRGWDANEIIRNVAAGRAILVAGSTWREDEEVLSEVAIDPSLLTVLVPHEPSREVCDALKRSIPNAALLSELIAMSDARSRPLGLGTIIIDRTGILAECYAVADIAYIGGAFGDGVHSALEPAANACALVSGPGIERSPDAMLLAHENLLHIVRTREECSAYVASLLRRPSHTAEEGERAFAFVRDRSGSSAQLAAFLVELMAARRDRTNDIDRV